MFCKRCGGVEEVLKIYVTDDFSPRLCDVQCLICGEIKYAQAYDFGSLINQVKDDDKNS